MSSNQTCSSSSWTWEENKAFENAVAMYSTDRNSLAQIAAVVTGRIAEDVSYHFESLFTDVTAIELGDVPLPHYSDSFKTSTKRKVHATVDNRGKRFRKDQIKFIDREISLQSDGNSRAPKPWSKEEQSLFLQGLQRFGKGDWRSISRFCVRSRTAVQVAIHAQKYPGDDFFELAFPGQYDISAPRGPMTGEVIWTDGGRGYSTVDFLECSFPYFPDFGACASRIASQPVAQPVQRNATGQPVPEPVLSNAAGEPVPEPVPANAAPPPAFKCCW